MSLIEVVTFKENVQEKSIAVIPIRINLNITKLSQTFTYSKLINFS